ncbi:PepSY domain-containing protein [Streptococcus orisasini]|uniref:PepSY domain-containing protein n=1 Tax=Streptococcus orisasini TaxID=1080071 RepID=UPI000709303D|nr:PepSY domain-containing protein [Streptococcus orisasini]
MKLTKKLPIVLAASLGLAGAAFVSAHSASAVQAISSEQAKTIALADAGLKANQVNSIKVHQDSDNDVPVFEVEFRSDQSDYDYTIDAATGVITEKDIDVDENHTDAQEQAVKISANDAKSIALGDAGLTEKQVSSLKVEAGSDNDVPNYKVEFKHGRLEYRYAVNALSGTITAKETN